MRRLGHRPQLDGIRGVAVLLVVLTHTSYWTGLGHSWTGGSLGVDLFFVLSGFLITALLLTEWGQDETIRLRAFYGRRARRLLPAALTLVGVFAVSAIAHSPEDAPASVGQALLRASYLSNFFIVFTNGGVGASFGHLWSLAQEEQFYLLWPIGLVVMLRRRVQPRNILLVLAGAIAVINIERLAMIAEGADYHRLWFAPDTHGDPILFGCAAAVLYSYGLVRLPKVVGALGCAVVLGLAAWCDIRSPAELGFVLPLFALATAGVLLVLVDHPSSGLSRLMSVRPLRGLGKISYGLYLWHWPLLTVFGVAGLPFALIASLASYRYVEQPILRRSRSKSGSVKKGAPQPVPAGSPAA